MDSLEFFPALLGLLGAPGRTLDAADAIPLEAARRFGLTCAVAGMVGACVWRIVLGQEDLPLVDSSEQARCVAAQWTAWGESIRPWLLARIPLAPVLGWALGSGLVWLLRTLAAAVGALPVSPGADVRLLNLALGPLALPVLPLAGMSVCAAWTLLVCGMAMRRAYGLSRGMAVALVAFPLCAWLGVELLVQIHIIMPCVSHG